MTDWIEIRATFADPPDDWSPYVDQFSQFGCPGVLQEDSPPSLSAYLGAVEGAELQAADLQRALLNMGAASVAISQVPNQDWSELWKIHFKPRRIGKRFVLVPTWESYVAEEGDKVVLLDPGQAFGTGDHPTTRLCLRLMEGIDLVGKSVLDVGCGSGVLAIASKLVGASQVVATDIDPQAVAITRENAALNQVEISAEVVDGFASGRQYDVVLSNIISATLIRLAQNAQATVRTGGHWIVSGVIKQNWMDVLARAQQCGFVLDTVEEEDDWIGAVFHR